MRQSLKVALSLLIAIVLFSGFAILAFSGLFDLLSVTFWNPRVEKDIVANLDSLAGKIKKYHELNIQRFTVPLEKQYAASAFQTIQLEADIKGRVNDFGSMQKDIPELVAIRFLDPDGKKVHFSTLPTDVKASSGNGIEYKMMDDAGSTFMGKDLVVADGAAPKVLMDGASGRFIYCLPIYQVMGASRLYKGTGLFYVGTNDLLSYLLRIPQTSVGSLSIVKTGGLLLSFPSTAAPEAGNPLWDSIDALWKAHVAGGAFSTQLPLTLPGPGGAAQAFNAFFTPIAPYGYVSLLASRDRFELTPVMKGLLLASFFLTVFLVVFLLFNIRPDPLEVLSQRIKRFQIQLLEQIMQTPGEVDWTRYRRELEARKGEITSQIEHGLGRVSARQKPHVEAYLSKSWDEILDLLGRRVQTPSAPSVDITHLEGLIKQALANAKFVIPAQKAAKPAERLAVEELAANDAEEPVEALEEADEAVAIAEETAEAAEEAVEELEEAEPAQEADAVSAVDEIEDVEPVTEVLEEADTAADAESLEEVEAVEEAEPVDEAEAVLEAEPASGNESLVEEAEAPEASEDAAAVDEALEEAPAAEDAETADLAEAPLEPESEPAPLEEEATLMPLQPQSADAAAEAEAELEELEPVEEKRIPELVEVRVPSSTAVELAFPEMDEVPPIEASEEHLEELETISEILPLPPEPVEEGLELLPIADEFVEHTAIIDSWRVLDDGEREENEIDVPAMVRSDAAPGARVKTTADLGTAAATAQEGVPRTETAGYGEAAEGKSSSKGMGLLAAGAHRIRTAKVESGMDKEFEHIQRALEEPRKGDELEELEEVSDAAEALAAAREAAQWTLKDQKEEISRLVAAGSIVSIPMDQLTNLVKEAKSAIVIQDGVFRIKDDVYTSAEHSRDLKLKDLADEIMRHDRSEEPPAARFEGNDGLSGIGDLIHEEEMIDLAKVVAADRDVTAPETVNMEKEKSWPLHFKKNGIDYDEFLSAYPRSFTHTSQMKSLVEISRRAFAVCAGILLKKQDCYTPELAVGANEKTHQLFRFPQNDPIAELLSARSAVVINRNASDIRTLRSRVDGDDLRYMKRLLFLPVVFRGQEGTMFFSFSADTDLSVSALLGSLKVQ